MLRKVQITIQMIVGVTIVLVITRLSTGSLNPIEVFRGDSLLLKILVGFFLLGISVQILNFFYNPWKDKNCAGCGRDILTYMQSHGMPMKCPACGRPFHRTCYLEKAEGLMSGCRRDGCSTAIPHY